ncbi:MAG: hypothetical protein RJQ10_10765 [Haliea sp.]|uniref:hypothetical protein n=1 Tax=Haliea sp. TaxID=1932666 RepID=UPI0032F01EB8
MHQRLTRRRNRKTVTSAGNLWLRSDLRAPVLPPRQRHPAPGTHSRPAVRGWMTWTLFGALLVTTAAAGHGFLATEPTVAATAMAASTAIPVSAPSPASALRQPETNPANTLPALYALEDTQQQLIMQVEEIQASNRALLSRLERLQAALAPEDTTATAR